MPPPHGVTRYHDYGCRCDVCRAAIAQRHLCGRAWRSVNSSENDGALRHGVRSTYVNHGCRCDQCVEAQRQANRRRPSRTQRSRS